jgi:hypothetical protein
MEDLKRTGLAASYAAGLYMIVAGCAPQEIKPVPRQVVAIDYETTAQLAQRVGRLSEEFSLDGIILDLGKNPKGIARYAGIDVSKQGESKTLGIMLYIGSNEDIERQVNELLSNKKYDNARIILEMSGFNRTGFQNTGINDMSSAEGDFVSLYSPKEGFSQISGRTMDELQKEISSGYRTVLVRVLEAIQRHLDLQK